MMILYTENPKDTTKELLELINEPSKVAGYKISIQKPVAFLYINRIVRREVLKCVCVLSRSVVSNSLQLRGLYPAARLLCPWNFPHQNTSGGLVAK